MKFIPKFLTIVGSILLLQSCVSYESLAESGKLYIGMSKNALEEAVFLANQFQTPFGITATREFYREAGVEILAPRINSQAFVFESVTIPSNPPLICLEPWGCDQNVGDGRLNSWHPNLEEARAYVLRWHGLARTSSPKKLDPRKASSVALPKTAPIAPLEKQKVKRPTKLGTLD